VASKIELKEYKEARRALIISKMKEETPDLLILERLLLARANLDLQPKASDFDPLEELGEGNFSRIYKAVNKFTKHVYAIKAIEKAQVQQIKRRHKNVYNEIMMEKKILSKLHHPNIVILYSTFHDATTLYYLLEYCDGGEVWSLLRFNGSPCPLPASMSRFYAAEVLNALEHMHGLGIVHRDLKPENVLLTASGHVKLIDFGTAKDLVDTSLNGPEFVGTAEYMSPEAVDNLPTGPSTDLWAFGCLVYQLFDGYSPFKAPSPYLSFLKIRRALMRPSKNVPEDVRELCELLLVKPTVERLRNATGRTMTECLRAVEVVETLSSKRKEEADEEKEEGGMVGSDEEEMALDDKKIQDEFGKGYRINDSGPPVFQSEIYR
jgi:3-phosphoinositide dependent protein kinase-1